jgi:hypothetical protein
MEKIVDRITDWLIARRQRNQPSVEIKEAPQIQGNTVSLPNCVWAKTYPVISKHTHFEIATERDYGNSHRSEKYSDKDRAIAEALKKRTKRDEYDDYHNGQSEVITQVTIIKEIIRVIQPDEKV